VNLAAATVLLLLGWAFLVLGRFTGWRPAYYFAMVVLTGLLWWLAWHAERKARP
jgi:VIT1/CCC1 family predicted Fe2+/Mn2+ transporter